MYNIIYETSRQSRFDARYWMLGVGTRGRPRRMVWGGRREDGSGWGSRVYLWRIHVDIWQNQYNIVKLKNKKKLKNKIRKKKNKKNCVFLRVVAGESMLLENQLVWDKLIKERRYCNMTLCQDRAISLHSSKWGQSSTSCLIRLQNKV